MNTVPETKPRKREPKPVPAPLSVSDKGRKRYRPKVDEFAQVTAERDEANRDRWQAHRAEEAANARAQRATRTLWLLGPVLFVGGVAAGVVFW